MGCFSFFPSKNLGALGDAGAIVTNNANLADLARMIRGQGQKARYDHEVLGVTSRMDEIQAAVLRVKLKGLDFWNDRRVTIAKMYREALEGVGDILRTFFVPKLCNHCANPPCVQVCPVGATFITPDGVVLVDDQYCIGCRYCIQACPYGARYMHPEKHVAGKCTFCYHRLVKGLVPACVEVCPTGARVFGEVEKQPTPLARFLRFNDIQVLKPNLNTKPKAYYANLDGEVR